MNGLFVLLPALLMTSTVRANPSIYATCAGSGWAIDIGVRPGPAGTDLIALTVDDGQGQINAYEASIPARNVKRALNAGLALNNTAKAGDQGTFKSTANEGVWTYQGVSHGLSCSRN